LKLCIVVGKFTYEGGSQVALNLALGLSQIGYQVTILSIKSVDKNFPENPFLVSLNSKHALDGFLQLLEFSKHHPQDIYLSIGILPNIQIGLLRFINRRVNCVVGSEHFAYSPFLGDYPKKIMYILFPLFKFAYKKLDGLLFVSHDLKNQFLFKNSFIACPVKVIYNPILKLNKSSFNYALEKGKILILGAGVLEHRKRWDLLIESFNRLLQRGYNAHLYIAGTGSRLDELKLLASSLHISDHITFLGYVSEIQSFMQNADVVALTSESEAFGMVLAEGLVSGTQVVSTDCFSGPAEVLGYGKYGHLAINGNIESITDSLEQAIINPKSKSCLEDAASRFDLMFVVKEYDKFFKSVHK
jgi:glycosyltransferase involved in cell wall biosynthesis